MSEQFEMPFIPDYQGDKREVVQTDTHVLVGDNNLQVVVQSDVDLHRQNEILNGWKKMWDHMRDNNMLSAPLGPLYVAMDIDHFGVMRQYTDIASVTTNDLVIGVGLTVATNGVGAEQASQQIDSAFRMIREWARENFFVNT